MNKDVIDFIESNKNEIGFYYLVFKISQIDQPINGVTYVGCCDDRVIGFLQTLIKNVREDLKKQEEVS